MQIKEAWDATLTHVPPRRTWKAGRDGPAQIHQGTASRPSWEDGVRTFFGSSELLRALAAAIQQITHPLGSSAVCCGVSIENVAGLVSVYLTVGWTGRLFSDRCETVVRWDLRRGQSVAAVLHSDSAAIRALPENVRQLDSYFATQIFPALEAHCG